MASKARIYLKICPGPNCKKKEVLMSKDQTYCCLRCRSDAVNARRRAKQKAMPKRPVGRKKSVSKLEKNRMTLTLGKGTKAALQSVAEKKGWSYNKVANTAIIALALRIELNEGGISG